MKVVLSGYGKMGHMIEKVLAEKGIECPEKSENIQSVPAELAAESVCIDFTTPQAFRENYRFLADHFKAVVVGTTGWNDIKDEVIAYFREKGTTMIYASNFSIGVNVLFKATELMSRLLKGQYEPYVLEMHHKHKLDAPSGTAKSLAAIVEENMEQKPDVQAVRCGEISGIHRIGFEGVCDRITIEHEAFSREGFARGAVEAALMTEQIHDVVEFKDLLHI